MDKREADFLAKLLTTFKLEADEHLKSISAGLLKLEKETVASKKKEIIETIFREAHSLKGAARSVSLDAIQSICQSLEDVLAAWKFGDISVSVSAFDVLYASLDIITKYIATGQKIDEVALAATVDQLEKIKNGEGQKSEEKQPKVKKEKKKAVASAKGEEEQSSVATITEKSTTEKSETKDKSRLKKMVKEQVPTEPKEKTPAPASPQPAPKELAHAQANQEKTIRIFSNKLDTLLQQVEEMLIIKLTSQQRVNDLKGVQTNLRLWTKKWGSIQSDVRFLQIKKDQESIVNQSKEENSLPVQVLDFLTWQDGFIKSLKDNLNKLTKNTVQDFRIAGSMVDTLLDETKKVLMQPFGTLLEAFPRMVRDLSHSLQKEVELSIEGESIEIDRRILEEMKDPLLHLIRNSIDHGIESPEERIKKGKPAKGKLDIKANQISGSSIEIYISDDGAGINTEAVRASALKQGIINENDKLSDKDIQKLIFQSGLSTSPIISELSGRGIGMGVVSEKVEKLGGQIFLESTEGKGTIFRIILPSTMATFRGIHIRDADQDFIIPTHAVKRVLRLKSQDVRSVENRSVITVDGKTLSFISLSDVLGINKKQHQKEKKFVLALILKVSEITVAFEVDQVLNEQEVFVKGLGKQLERVKNFSAATIMEWGKVIPILDPFDLVKSAIKNSNVRRISQDDSDENVVKTKSILLVEDSVTARMLLKNILESAGYLVKTAIDGVEGYNILKTEEVDLVLSDVEMPRMDGFELTEKIRHTEKYKDIPIVLCTSRGSKEDREHGIDVGANAYIDKSGFAQSNLLEIIQKLL